jgi:hypothetical protein
MGRCGRHVNSSCSLLTCLCIFACMLLCFRESVFVSLFVCHRVSVGVWVCVHHCVLLCFLPSVSICVTLCVSPCHRVAVVVCTSLRVVAFACWCLCACCCCLCHHVSECVTMLLGFWTAQSDCGFWSADFGVRTVCAKMYQEYRIYVCSYHNVKFILARCLFQT